MLEIILKILWFFLPAAFANMAPIFFKNINFLNKPIDGGLKINDRVLFGKNKTYRGFFFGILLSIIIVYLQTLAYPFVKSITLLDYTQINILALGFLLGFGALFGDLIKSMLKRQFDIPPGDSWIPFDQIDWIIGAFIFARFEIYMPFYYFIIAILLYGILHILINLLGYYLGFKKNML